VKTAFASQMREMDRKAIKEYHIPGIELMEKASRTVFNRAVNILEEKKYISVTVVCGTGNNGGDGFAVARMIDTAGYDVKIITAGNTEKIKGDALTNYVRAKDMGIEISADLNMLNNCDLIIDAIFGTGFKGAPREEFAETIEKINSAGKYVLSIDIPSGINADNGNVEGVCVKADETVTFVMPKTGMLLYPAAECCGKIIVTDIGIPREIIENHDAPCFYLSEEEAKRLLPIRRADGNKGTFGKVYVLAGSQNMMGAAYFSAAAAYKAGCGLVFSCVPEEKIDFMQTMLPEAVEKPLKTLEGRFCMESYNGIENELSDARAAVIGPGIGKGKGVTEFVKAVLENCSSPMVIDADALNAAATDTAMLKEIKSLSVITPHMMEMSRLTGFSIPYIKNNMVQCAKEFSKEYNVVVVLKDARTVIASPDGRVHINITGNTALSKGGSGDVLTGIIAGLISQGMNVYDAAVLGVYLHGKCGEIASERLTEYSVFASDIINTIPEAIKTIM